MAMLESRQVVVWSIPTIAALVLSLVWLRRRRQRDPGEAGPPSPPPTATATPKQQQQLLPSSTPAQIIRSSPILIPLSPISLDSVDQPPFPEGIAEIFKREESPSIEEDDSEEESERGEEEEQEVIAEREVEPVVALAPAYDGNLTVELSSGDYTSSSQIPDSGVGTLSGVLPGTDPEQQSETADEESTITLSEQLDPEDPDSETPNVTEDQILPETDSMLGSLPENPPSEIVNERPVEDSEEVTENGVEETLIAPEPEVAAVKEDRKPAESEVNPTEMEKGVLEQKLASLELDTMKISEEANKENAERDSANQSPSEVMLASPSISNFSDANSEGSSDSGKGHSDVATSPSRTPAGGSSLAGDSAFSVYEFILPQVMVGRLIGRHGSFIHEIRTQTHTNIFIKRHPDTSKLKICAIEGTQQDIDKAIEKIRQKFPLRRFPKLTLEKVSFVSLNTAPPLKAEDFHLQLVEGVNNDVILSSLISAAHFFLQQPSHPTYTALSRLNQVMNVVYSNEEAPLVESPVKDAVCAAPTMGGWYRAQIMSIDEENLKCDVRFLDYGGYLTLETSLLRQIRGDLLMLPFQAVECYLANVTPVGEEGWSEEARLLVQSLTHGQFLQAQIYNYAENGVPQVYLYSTVGSQIVLINEELVANGHATIVTPPAEE